METIKLKTGVLKVKTNKISDELVAYGSRINKKRGFFFVSKVTGNHLPVKPSLMHNTYKKLAKLIPKSNEPTLFIGFAEAATALGQGVFEELDLHDSFYIHSTRFKTSNKILLSFSEDHSHAPSHIFYEPIDENIKSLLHNIKRIILIDDEVSTGNTANNLVNELKVIFPDIKNYYVVSILNWATTDYDNFKSISLYKGSFSFIDKKIKSVTKIKSEPKVIKHLDKIIPYNFARYGVKKLNLDLKHYVNLEELREKKILVLGTAEFMYPPYLLAKYLEDNGIESYFQSTTRSPINIDGAITSKLDFADNYFENIDNFLYNVMDEDYDKVLICYETTLIPKEFDLKEQLSSKFSIEEIFFYV